MLHVYILEDNKAQREAYQQIIESYLFIEGLDMRVELATADPQLLLNEVAAHPDFRGLFFLDIELKAAKKDGLQVATEIREQLGFAEIVFVTTHSEMAFLTFERKVEPLDFVLKDNGREAVAKNLRDDIGVALRRYQTHLLTSEQHFSYQIGSRIYEIPMTSLLYVATIPGHPGKIEVHHDQGIVEYPGNLNALETKYHNLFRCHKSFLINPARIQNYDVKSRLVTMQDGSRCEVSFRKESRMRKVILQTAR